MMKVWVMQGSYEGELFSSVHLTEKGCALGGSALSMTVTVDCGVQSTVSLGERGSGEDRGS